MKICIVGAGWYGCHIASALIQAGHSVKVYEKSNSTISGASKKNQNRLHLGFHYPRCSETRKQSKEGFDWFIEHYEHLTKPIKYNYYGVAEHGSLLDFDTYKVIMEASGLSFEEVERPKFLSNLSNLLECGERVIRNELASNYFNSILASNLVFNTYVDLNNLDVLAALQRNFDFVVDCSWGTARKIDELDYYYEPCVYMYYRCKNNKDEFALTIMDGKHYSLYPYYEGIYTLTSVEHTPLGQFDEINEAVCCLANFKNDKQAIDSKLKVFESEFSNFYPNFKDNFSFDSVEFSLKTKIRSNNDFRGCVVKVKNNLISVFSGKIDTLHVAEREVFKAIHK